MSSLFRANLQKVQDRDSGSGVQQKFLQHTDTIHAFGRLEVQ